MRRRLRVTVDDGDQRQIANTQIRNWVEVRRLQAVAQERECDQELLVTQWRNAAEEERLTESPLEKAAQQLHGGVATLLAAGPGAQEALVGALRSAVVGSLLDSRGPIPGFHEYVPRLAQGPPPRFLRIRYPFAVAVTVVGAMAAAVTIVFGNPRLALLPLTVAVVADMADGALAKRDPRRRAAGMYTACLTSHFMDLVILAGIGWNLSADGHHQLALLTASATIIALFGSFTRTAAYQVGVHIERAMAERFVRVGGIYVGLALAAPWVAAVAMASFGIMEVAYVLWTVWTSRVRSMAVVVEHEALADRPFSWWGWDISALSEDE